MISQSFTQIAFCFFCSPHGNDKMIINGLQLSIAMHVYGVRPVKIIAASI